MLRQRESWVGLAYFWRIMFLMMKSAAQPEDIKDIIPYIVSIHGKFYEMTEDCREPSVDYENIVPRLAELGYDGYIVSEYEGQRWVEDINGVDSIEQVRRQHVMLKRLLGH